MSAKHRFRWGAFGVASLLPAVAALIIRLTICWLDSFRGGDGEFLHDVAVFVCLLVLAPALLSRVAPSDISRDMRFTIVMAFVVLNIILWIAVAPLTNRLCPSSEVRAERAEGGS
jgi:hypothetical protein